MDEIPPAEENYDSDSSLTQAANKSLDLSRSLGDRCAEITQAESSEDEEEETGRAKLEGEAGVEREKTTEENRRNPEEEPVHIVEVTAISSGLFSSCTGILEQRP